MYTPKRDTMRLRSKSVIAVVSSPLLIALCFAPAHYWLQAQDAARQIQATPLPKDVDPNDPALPVWMRPASTRAAAAPSSTPAPKAPANVPPGEQPPPPSSAASDVGEVRKQDG